MTDFKQDIDKVSAHLAENVPKEKMETVEKGYAAVKDTGIDQKALKTGDQAPDFELPNVKGTTTKLYDLLASDKVILVFYRGAWCPYCNVHLAHFQKLLPQFKEVGAKLVAVSPQSPDNSISTAESKQLEFEVLSDTEGKAADKFNLLFSCNEDIKKPYTELGMDVSKYNTEETAWKLPLPATYVIGKSGEIKFAHVDVDVHNRADPNKLLEIVKNL
eukprot:gb/GECH01010744.1/.p1 GENE.gb/GECH01010744.1/~~gb/GECH01010744.1/.p1  ORF type:complete len:217 (+),score=38.96 gb/GECH01010744.1/:1-651(+)